MLIIVLLSSVAVVAILFLLIFYFQTIARVYRQTLHRSDIAISNKSEIISDYKVTALAVVGTASIAIFLGVVIGMVGVILGLVIGAIFPWIYRKIQKRKRDKEFVYQLPDALSSISSSMKGGASLSKALEGIAKRHPKPISEEFSIVLAEGRVGLPIEDSLKKMMKRVSCKELELFTTAIVISKSVGGNLADTMEVLSDTLREKAQIEGKIDALTATGKAQGWVVSFLPLGVGIALYMQDPRNMSLMFTTFWGMVVLGIVLCMLALAVWMIFKIVSIDV